jgi:hypothetical protein
MPRIPKALRAKFIKTRLPFRDSFGSARASSRRFWWSKILILLISALVAGELFAREVKYPVIHRHVGFNLVDYDPLLVGPTLAPELD